MWCLPAIVTVHTVHGTPYKSSLLCQRTFPDSASLKFIQLLEGERFCYQQSAHRHQQRHSGHNTHSLNPLIIRWPRSDSLALLTTVAMAAHTPSPKCKGEVRIFLGGGGRGYWSSTHFLCMCMLAALQTQKWAWLSGVLYISQHTHAKVEESSRRGLLVVEGRWR